LGHALFDLGRYPEAAPWLQHALIELNTRLQSWARTKLSELLLCCRIRTNSLVTLDEVEALHAQYLALGLDAPVPAELHAAIRECSGGLVHEKVDALFGSLFTQWRLDERSRK
jgi:hypothetical protein